MFHVDACTKSTSLLNETRKCIEWLSFCQITLLVKLFIFIFKSPCLKWIVIPWCFVVVPDSTPENVTAVVNGTEVQLRWSEPSGKMNGQLQGYMMEYISPNMEQVNTNMSFNILNCLFCLVYFLVWHIQAYCTCFLNNLNFIPNNVAVCA